MGDISQGFKIRDTGVLRIADNAAIPQSDQNTDWLEYQQWVADGNAPAVEFTAQEIAQQIILDEVNTLKEDLRRTDHWLFRMILAVWEVGITKGLWANADITDTALKQKVAAWKIKLDRLLELGE